jgi:NAD(P)H-dependent flavin oxidoreductase YrpB (nitropropane dioxygenase family)
LEITVKTPVTEMLGIEFPILAFSHCRDVVAEVTRAGGFGVLGATAHTPDALAVDLQWIKDQVGGKPFGVDVLLPSKHAAPDTAKGPDPLDKRYYDFVNELLARYGVEPLDPENESRPVGAFGELTDPEALATKLLDVAFEYDIGLIASALGSPPPALVSEAKSRNVVVAALAGKVQHAERHVAAGVDLVVAQGYEAGGHTGEVSTMVLVPEVVDAVAPVPVVAAGGIGRGRQMAASLALGAGGVWCGSVWLTTTEAETHPVVKERFLEARSDQTIRSRARTGKPARQLVSAWTEAWQQPDAPPTLPLPTQYRVAEPALYRAHHSAEAGNDAARQLATYFVGQIVGSMNTVKPTRQVVFELIDELIDAVNSINTQLGDH